MDELLKFLRHEGGQGDVIGVWESILALGLALICISVICGVYRFTHKGANYSQSFVQTLVMTGLVTTLIMVVIGSNIARAFSLVGALSIIRFRNAVKETRDVGYIFFAMAVAMACGTRFYSLAILATVVICSVMIIMYLFNFGSSRIVPERLLSVQLRSGLDPEQHLKSTMDSLFDSYSIVSLGNARQGLYSEVQYSVRPRTSISGGQVLEAISEANDNLKVTYRYGAHTDEL